MNTIISEKVKIHKLFQLYVKTKHLHFWMHKMFGDAFYCTDQSFPCRCTVMLTAVSALAAFALPVGNSTQPLTITGPPVYDFADLGF